MHPAPAVDSISKHLVRAFAFMVEHPDEWFSAAEIAAAADASTTMVYRRFGNLVSARVLRSKQLGGFRHYKLHPGWEAARLAVELRARHLKNTCS